MTISRFCKIIVLVGMIAVFSGSATALELIVNGDFLQPTPVAGGIPGWVTNANPMSYNPSIHIATQHDTIDGPIVVAPGNSLGTYSSSWISQSIHVPRDAVGNTISFYYQWFITNNFGVLSYSHGNFGSIELFREQAPSVMPADPTPTPGWTDQQFCFLPLENYSDQTVDLLFEAHSDTVSWPQYLFVDDISLLVETATKTNTPTYTPTYTITKTRTITETFTYTPTITPTYTITQTITQTRTVTPWPVPHGDAMAFPNPASGDQVIFMYSLELPADISIEIYNTLGYKVAHLEDSNKSGQVNRRTTWNIRDVAPGVYMYQVVVRRHNGQTQKNKLRRVVITK